MQVTEETLFPAAEWEESHWRCNANIDADIPGIGFIPKTAGSITTGGEQAGLVPICPAVNQLDRFVNGLQVDQAEHWSENFCLGYFASDWHILQDGRSDKSARFITLDLCAAPIYQRAGAFSDAALDQSLDAFLTL